jgi:hypothetical protein
MLCQCRNPLTVPTLAATQMSFALGPSHIPGVDTDGYFCCARGVSSPNVTHAKARIALATKRGRMVRQLPSKKILGHCNVKSRNAGVRAARRIGFGRRMWSHNNFAAQAAAVLPPPDLEQ